MVACIAAAPTSATAQTNEPATALDSGNTVLVQPGQQQPVPENGDDIICRIVPPTTGTRLGGGRECHKRREWAQRQQDAQDILQRHQQIGFIWAPKGPGH